MRDIGEASLAAALFGVALGAIAGYTIWVGSIGRSIGHKELCAEICGPHYSTTEPDTMCLCLEVSQ